MGIETVLQKKGSRILHFSNPAWTTNKLCSLSSLSPRFLYLWGEKIDIHSPGWQIKSVKHWAWCWQGVKGSHCVLSSWLPPSSVPVGVTLASKYSVWPQSPLRLILSFLAASVLPGLYLWKSTSRCGCTPWKYVWNSPGFWCPCECNQAEDWVWGISQQWLWCVWAAVGQNRENGL